mmetsp:Transcript_46155/g.76303  ORF Transcript_46155/g.76303 Transcript_46155/m.76303 type:complete len:232 (-) Transcript_46155:242-937(-)
MKPSDEMGPTVVGPRPLLRRDSRRPVRRASCLSNNSLAQSSMFSMKTSSCAATASAELASAGDVTGFGGVVCERTCSRATTAPRFCMVLLLGCHPSETTGVAFTWSLSATSKWAVVLSTSTPPSAFAFACVCISAVVIASEFAGAIEASSEMVMAEVQATLSLGAAGDCSPLAAARSCSAQAMASLAERALNLIAVAFEASQMEILSSAHEMDAFCSAQTPFILAFGSADS